MCKYVKLSVASDHIPNLTPLPSPKVLTRGRLEPKLPLLQLSNNDRPERNQRESDLQPADLQNHTAAIINLQKNRIESKYILARDKIK